MATLFNRLIGPVPLDVVVREQHESDLTITKNPIEFGADVTDHAYIEPKRVVLEAIAGSELGRRTTPAAAWQLLVRFQETREPFTLVTGLNVYNNMLLEKLTPAREASTSSVLSFIAEISEAIIVDTATSPEQANAPEGGQAKRLNGQKATDTATKNRASSTVQRGDNVGSSEVIADGAVAQNAAAGSSASMLYRVLN